LKESEQELGPALGRFARKGAWFILQGRS
jgi:hypothetical protein